MPPGGTPGCGPGHAAWRALRVFWAVVLGDWYEQGSVLRVDANGWTLDTLSRE